MKHPRRSRHCRRVSQPCKSLVASTRRSVCSLTLVLALIFALLGVYCKQQLCFHLCIFISCQHHPVSVRSTTVRGRKVLILIFLSSSNCYSYTLRLNEVKFLMFLHSCRIVHALALTSFNPHFSLSLLCPHVPLQVCSKSVITPQS